MSSTRVQLALNVDNIGEATAFYSRMFGVALHKQRDGYANFAIEDPPLKLVLIENPGAGERLNHLGIEASTPEQVTARVGRRVFHMVSGVSFLDPPPEKCPECNATGKVVATSECRKCDGTGYWVGSFLYMLQRGTRGRIPDGPSGDLCPLCRGAWIEN